ncbi:hypothetical protein [Rhodoferax sp.]|jgi:hypothetical protein|uniref:hypothetical protein n=1 Tax=Rhodoferax sp. TaxID=50421 RepID=UPI003BAF9461
MRVLLSLKQRALEMGLEAVFARGQAKNVVSPVGGQKKSGPMPAAWLTAGA